MIVMIGGLALLAGCGNQGNKAANVPTTPKWQGAPYHIALDTKASKPNPSGVAIPAIHFTANPDALERRASLVVRFDSAEKMKKRTGDEQDHHGPGGYFGRGRHSSRRLYELADKGLSGFLGAYCMKGKIKVSVALAMSSLTSQAGDAEVDQKRLSDWLPFEFVFKNTHPKC